MKKILFFASTVSHINNFHVPYIKGFHDMGYEVHVATNDSGKIEYVSRVIQLPLYKNIFSPKNFLAIIQSRKLIKSENYEKISSNTTLGGLIVRFSVLFLKKRPRIYHIVHGYHFNIHYRLRKYIYIIPEKIAALVSDVVMVMNQEDYQIAKKYKLYRSKLFYINGIGVNLSRFKAKSIEEKNKRKLQMGLLPTDTIFSYVAEFSKRKNHKLLIRAFAECGFPNAKLLLAGDGKTISKCRKLANRFNQDRNIIFLGYVKNVPELYGACDVVVSTSRIEGLPFNVVEAMSCCIPVIASDIKGHRELVDHKRTGLLFKSEDKRELCKCLNEFYNANLSWIASLGQNGTEEVSKYSIEFVFPQVMEIYKQ